MGGSGGERRHGVGRARLRAWDSPTRRGTGGAAVTIDPTRRGGDTAPPAGAFRRQGSTLDVVVEERADPGWLGFSGWEVPSRSRCPVDVTVAAPEMSLDVSGLRISGLDVQGSGIVVLGDEPAAVTVSGDLTLVLPVGVAAVLTGSAHVPDGLDGDRRRVGVARDRTGRRRL